MADRETVMISSTMLDLPDHRERVRDACLQQGVYPSMMEYLPASGEDAITKSLDLVDQADIYVGVFGHRYGFVPAGSTISITEMEYNRAVERRIDRLIFIMGDDHNIKIADVEFDDGLKRLSVFKDRLKSENIVRFFRSADELKADVIDALSRYSRSDPLRLSSPQLALYEGLNSKDLELGRIYLGALTVLERSDIPDYLIMAAHQLRELIEKLPRYLDVPIASKPPSLKGKVRELGIQRVTVVRISSSKCESGWSGEIDKHLANFLVALDRFFDWFDTVHLTRKQRAAKVLTQLDPSRRTLPNSLQTKQINQWNDWDDYFKNVSHHSFVVDEGDFRRRLSEIETFLVDKIQPHTVEDFERIDRLIEEGEVGGHN